MKYLTISTLLLVSVVLPSSGNAFVIPSFSSSKYSPSIQHGRTRDIKMEDFGLGIGEDPAKNTPNQILGEARYKNFVGSYKKNSLLLGGQPNQPNQPNYDVIDRVSETRLLSLTAESGLLSALEAKGLTLSDLEKILPLIDELNLLPLAKENKQFILNTLAPLVVERSNLAIPLAVSLLKTSPSFFTTLAAGAVGSEVALTLLQQNTLIDIVGGLVLLPLSVASYTAGNLLKNGVDVDALASAAKNVAKPSTISKPISPSSGVKLDLSTSPTKNPSRPAISKAAVTSASVSTIGTNSQRDAKSTSSSRPKVTLSVTNSNSPKITEIDSGISAGISKSSKSNKTFNFKAIKPKQSGISNWSTKN